MKNLICCGILTESSGSQCVDKDGSILLPEVDVYHRVSAHSGS